MTRSPSQGLPLQARRGLLRALGLLLAPLVLVMGTMSPANASDLGTSGDLVVEPDSSWGIAQVYFPQGGIDLGAETTCTFAVRYGNDALDLEIRNGVCRGGIDSTLGWVQIPEPGTWYTWIAAGFSTDLGQPCGFGSPAEPDGTLGGHPSDGWNVWSTIPDGDYVLAEDGAQVSCEVSSLCLDLYSDDGPGEQSTVACVDLTGLPLPVEDTSGECPYGYPLKVTEEHLAPPYQNYSRFVVHMQGNVDQRRWAGWAVGQNGGSTDWTTLGGWGYGNFLSPSNGATGWTFTFDADVWDPATNYQTKKPFPGVQVWYNPQYPDPVVPGAPPELNSTPQQGGGKLGLTDEDICSYYIGTKIAQTPENDLDEPWSGLDQDYAPGPADEDPPAVDPEENDAPADESSFWAQVLAALAALAAALLILPKAIASAILEGLSALFVPTDAPSFTDIPSPLPNGWLPDLPSMGGNACGAVVMPALTLGYEDMGVPATTLFNSCTEPWPLVRKFTYNGMLAGILVTACWAAFAAVMGALGMRTGSSGGGDDE